MPFKIFAGLIAMVIMLTYLAAPVIKLQDIPLGVVVLIGVAMMLVDLWQSMQSKDD